jgi:hypothetical protein
MNDLVLANRAADWSRLKALVLDSVSSPITKRVYNLAGRRMGSLSRSSYCRAHVGPDYRAVPRDAARPGTCAERWD